MNGPNTGPVVSSDWRRFNGAMNVGWRESDLGSFKMFQLQGLSYNGDKVEKKLSKKQNQNSPVAFTFHRALCMDDVHWGAYEGTWTHFKRFM